MQGQDDPAAGTLELTGDATDAYVYPGKTYYSTDPKMKRTGTMPVQAAKTITPGASAQTVAAGRYLTGAITVPGFALPAANTIKKGTTINIYGRTVTGTFEGYVPTPLDLYYHGVNNANFSTNGGVFQNTIIKQGANVITLTFGKTYNVRSNNYLNISGYYVGATREAQLCYFKDTEDVYYTIWGNVIMPSGKASSSINITQLTDITTKFFIRIQATNFGESYTERIWLS